MVLVCHPRCRAHTHVCPRAPTLQHVCMHMRCQICNVTRPLLPRPPGVIGASPGGRGSKGRVTLQIWHRMCMHTCCSVGARGHTSGMAHQSPSPSWSIHGPEPRTSAGAPVTRGVVTVRVWGTWARVCCDHSVTCVVCACGDSET